MSAPNRKGYAPGHISIFHLNPSMPSQLRALDEHLIQRGLDKGYPLEEILGIEETELQDEDNMDGDF